MLSWATGSLIHKNENLTGRGGYMCLSNASLAVEVCAGLEHV